MLRTVCLLGLSGALCLSAAAAPPKEGEKAPDFTLKSLADKEVKLSEMLEKGPVVLVMLRGWPGYQCPICSQQVGKYLAKKDAFAKEKATVLLVYPGPENDLTLRAQEFLKGRDLPGGFVMVTDPDYKMTNAYDLRWEAERETAYPATFVIDRDAKVRFAKVSEGHAGRTLPAEALAVLEKVR